MLLNLLDEIKHHLIASCGTLVGFIVVQYEDVFDDIKSPEKSGNCDIPIDRTASRVVALGDVVSEMILSEGCGGKLSAQQQAINYMVN